MIDRQLAIIAQEVKLNLVEIRADEFKPATTAPTTQEVQEQFRKYANVPPGEAKLPPLSTTSPSTMPASLPFGYRYPDRVKLQYLQVKRDQVRDAVKKGKDPYEWEVAAQRYFLAHQADYQVTQPTASPLGPALPNAAAAPTTRPFAEVKEQVMEKVMQPEVERVTAEVRTAVAKRLAAGWEQYHGSAGAGAATRPGGATATRPASASASRPTGGPASGPAGAPATAPAGTQPTGYPSFAFLEQVAAEIQKQFGVLPSITSKADQWLTVDDLGKLPGIGVARTTADDGRSFANYVLQSAEPFMPVPEKADPARVLSVLEPSEPLEDFDSNVYFFRLTDAQAAHAPTDLAEVREKVEADVIAGRAYARAADEATKLLEAARKQGLDPAAAAMGRRVIATGNFSQGRFGPTTIPNYPLEADARRTLATEAYKLLEQATPQRPNPVAMITLPSERKILVAELAGVTNQLNDNQNFVNRMDVARRLAFRQVQDLVTTWFKADAVKSRLGYRSADPEEDKRKASEGPEQAALD
jgi:hypothetical protein